MVILTKMTMVFAYEISGTFLAYESNGKFLEAVDDELPTPFPLSSHTQHETHNQLVISHNYQSDTTLAMNYSCTAYCSLLTISAMN